MTSVFREIPCNFWLLLYSTEESEAYTNVYEKDTLELPTSLSKLLEILSNSHKCHFIGKVHEQDAPSNGSLDEFCQALPPNHYHLLYLPQCTTAETFLKQTISKVLSNLQSAKVRLLILTVSYPENFLRTEMSSFSNRSFVIEGERMKSMLNRKTTESLGCKFNSVWELDRHNSLGYCTDNEKALYVELEKSDAPFKDTVVPYIELLQRGIGRLFVTEHSRTLDIDLGHSNAQGLYLLA